MICTSRVRSEVERHFLVCFDALVRCGVGRTLGSYLWFGGQMVLSAGLTLGDAGNLGP